MALQAMVTSEGNPGWPQAAPTSLNALGTRHGTDKAAGGHAYLDFYERFLGEMRDRPVRLLEIGVHRGRSLRMWRDYFSNGQIVGVDIDPATRREAGERIVIEIADQSNVADLVRLGTQHGPFDIVVDDGSHIWGHQITTLHYLYPFVRPGGFYVLEDIHTSYGEIGKSYRGGGRVSAARYLQRFCDYMIADLDLDIGAEQDAFIRSYAGATEFVAFHRRTAVMRRLSRPRQRPEAFAPIAPALGDGVPSVSLTVHAAFRGDEVNPGGLGGLHHSRQPIQGFAMQLPGAATALEYRALLNDLTWTPWTPGGSFVGTRGKELSLRGFAVRLVGELAARYACRYAGAFVDEPDPVMARDGDDCRSASGAELETMQVVLQPRTAQERRP